jgi:hypothetical protein
MSGNNQKKFMKQKKRERAVKQKLLVRRKVIEAKRKEENEQFKKMKRIKKLKKEMGHLNQWADDVLLGLNNKTLSQLEHNVKILRALEEEYEKERAKKKDLNKELENKGLVTLEEKLNFLHNKIVEQQKLAFADMPPVEAANAGLGSGKPEEVAEISVLKAPVEVAEVEIVKVPEQKS